MGTVRPPAAQEDEKLVPIGAARGGDGTVLAIDAGGSYPFWKLRYKDALERRADAGRLRVYWFEEPLRAGRTWKDTPG